MAIIATALTEVKGYRQFHWGLTLVYNEILFQEKCGSTELREVRVGS